MKVVINGEDRSFESPLTLAGLVQTLGMKTDRVAVELNRDIVPRDRWDQTHLADGDRLEIVHFVGGGSSHPVVRRGRSALSRERLSLAVGGR